MRPVEEQPDMADNLYSRWASRYPEGRSYQLSEAEAISYQAKAASETWVDHH
jgi:hypothetical protein